MGYKCPLCGRFGVEWDARAKVLNCLYTNCTYLNTLIKQKEYPTPKQIMRVLGLLHFSRAEKAGNAAALAIIEMVHLMYQNNTKANFYCGLMRALNKEINNASK